MEEWGGGRYGSAVKALWKNGESAAEPWQLLELTVLMQLGDCLC